MNDLEKKFSAEAYQAIQTIKNQLRMYRTKLKVAEANREYEEAIYWRDERDKFEDELKSLFEIKFKI